MSEQPRPQPGEQWRTYFMTPYGPGAITSLVEVIEVVQDHKHREIVRYVQVHPTQAEHAEELPLQVFVDSRMAPDEDEADWMKRRRASAGPVRPDEEQA